MFEVRTSIPELKIVEFFVRLVLWASSLWAFFGSIKLLEWLFTNSQGERNQGKNSNEVHNWKNAICPFGGQLYKFYLIWKDWWIWRLEIVLSFCVTHQSCNCFRTDSKRLTNLERLRWAWILQMIWWILYIRDVYDEHWI